MGRVTEKLNGGLVTSKDPAFLEPGELSDIRNMVYRPGINVGLNRAPGRTSYGAVSATAVDVVGIRDIHFDNDDAYLLTHASSNYYRGPVAVTGTFTLLASGLGIGSQLERVHFRNRFFLFNGVQASGVPGASATADTPASNRVVYLSATAAASTPLVRFHGLLPITYPPTITTAAGSFSQSVTGFYEYWTTEVQKLVQDNADVVLEGTFSGSKVATQEIASTGTVPTIQRPSQVNANATHWRIYRSPKKDLDSDKKFPSGFQVGSDIPISVVTASDSRTSTTSSFVFPTLYNVAPAYYTDWMGATALGADDGVVASASAGAASVVRTQGCYGFSFSGIVGQINGITVSAEGYVAAGSAPVPINVAIGIRNADGGVFKSAVGKTGLITSTSPGAPTVLTFGSSADRWSPPNSPGFSADDFNANFMVAVSIATPNVTVALDYVKMAVSYAATPAGDSTIQFPTVVYTFGDITSQVGKNGPPPSASTGDLYEDSLVVNDVSNAALIRFSFPGEPESFPASYFVDFETDANDAVTAIKVVNERLVVLLKTSAWRVNYLPSERDASFDGGKCKQPISESYGCVNPMCAVVYSPGGGAQRLAFVSNKGIFSTDGFRLDDMTESLNWNLIRSDTATYTPIALIDDPEESCLRYQFRNDESSYGNETFRELRLHYDGRISGPVFMRNFDTGSSTYATLRSAHPVPTNTGDTAIYYGYGGASTAAGAGKVYIENGTTIPSNDASARYTTRAMYLGEMGGEFTLTKLGGYCSTYAGTPVVTYTSLNSVTNDAGETSGDSHAVTLAGGKMHRAIFAQVAEGMRIQASIAGATDYVQEQIILEGDGLGSEDSGK